MSASERMPWGFVLALSTSVLISYGTLFYAFALLLEPMEQELGWSKSALTAGYSLSLVASALFAVPIGRLIDRGYGRVIMTGGSLLGAAMLVAWSQVQDYTTFLLIWIGLGAAMSAVLYEPGFAILALRLRFQVRRGITVMTLVAGFASTVFIPLTHMLIEIYGWRGSLLVLAVFNLPICALIHLVFIPGVARMPHRRPAGEHAMPERYPTHLLRRASFWCFVVMSVCQGFVSTGIPIHLIPILVEQGYTLEWAVIAYSTVGPMQVGARFLTGFGDNAISLTALGVITMSLSTLAFGILPFVSTGPLLLFSFAVFYGASNGMLTIVRALLPPELFGQEDYGTIQGMISLPVRLAQAVSPFAFGAMWGWWGNYDVVLILSFLMALASLLAFLVVAKLPKGLV